MTKKKRKKLLAFFFCNSLCSLFHRSAFSCALGYNPKLGCRRVGSASKRVVAFFAFPDAYAFAFNLHEAALGTSMGLFKFHNHLSVPFSNGASVSRS